MEVVPAVLTATSAARLARELALERPDILFIRTERIASVGFAVGAAIACSGAVSVSCVTGRDDALPLGIDTVGRLLSILIDALPVDIPHAVLLLPARSDGATTTAEPEVVAKVATAASAPE